MSPTGRFAPSPTGPLHFGSLVAALASWLDARRAGGRWLVRMEDLDLPRVMPGAADTILRQLEAFGLHWDGEVVFQSRRAARYAAALEKLGPQAYPCACSRKELEDSALAIDGARVYPGTCRDGLAASRRGRASYALRLRTDEEVIAFVDRLQGPQAQRLARDVGDFVLRRADGLHTYQLAVVVDDADQGVTDVVRGADLLDSTARQVLLQRRLGLPTPRYLHVPVVVDDRGEKLSKQTHAPDAKREHLRAALVFLGHAPPADLVPPELLAWALAAWDPARVPAARALALSGGPAPSP